MTPDQPISLAVVVFFSVLCCTLPLRYAILPLAIVMCAYPTNVLLPPPQLQLNVPRVVAGVLFLRCLFSAKVRQRFHWSMVDTAAIIYFLLLMISQLSTATDTGAALNNRAGYFLNALVPFFCVRMLVVDRDAFNILIKGFLWTALPLALLGLYQAQTGDSPYRFLMERGALWDTIKVQWTEQRTFLGRTTFRASAPFGQCIMFGWFFAILVAPGTNLFWEKRKLLPWVIPWLFLPLGSINTVSAGPMSMCAMTLAISALFPMRKYWKAMFGTVVAVYLAVSIFARRSPMEIIASQGLDQSSSWYRINLTNFTMNFGMEGHWWTGYGLIPQLFNAYHDLCIQWIYLVVIYGIFGVVAFHLLLAAVAWSLWRAKKLANSVADEWLLWTLMATLLGTILAMQVVALFGEMFWIYHLFLGVVANAPLLVGNSVGRQVGVLAELNGKPVLLRYTLRPGQKLAIVPAPTVAGVATRPATDDGPSH